MRNKRLMLAYRKTFTFAKDFTNRKITYNTLKIRGKIYEKTYTISFFATAILCRLGW